MYMNSKPGKRFNKWPWTNKPPTLQVGDNKTPVLLSINGETVRPVKHKGMLKSDVLSRLLQH